MGDEVALSRHRVSVLGSAVLILFVLGACVSPARSWWRHAADAGFDSTVIAGDPFRHVILEGRGHSSRALHVYLDDGGLLTLDLSRAFRQGFHGGSRAEEFAVGSLVRTIASNLPEVKQVRLVCGGAPLTTLGGHVALDRPLDPDDWQ